MNLDITSELVRDLYDRLTTTRRPDETGIVLTADGWDTDVWTTPSAPWPVALTGDDIHALLDGDEPASGADMDDDIVASLTEPDQGHGATFAVPDEDGESRTPGHGTLPQVVTCDLTGDGDPADPGSAVETLHWTRAWWFDLNTARRLLTTLGHRDSYERDFELWITGGGRYVARRSSSHVAEPGDSWVELTAEQAALWLYRADDDHIDEALTDEHGLLPQDAPAIVVGARALRTAADAVAAPRVPVTDLGDTTLRHPDRVHDEAFRVQEDAAALASLARDVVAPTLGRTRRQAVRVLVEVNGQSGTARLLGISQPTINNLIK